MREQTSQLILRQWCRKDFDRYHAVPSNQEIEPRGHRAPELAKSWRHFSDLDELRLLPDVNIWAIERTFPRRFLGGASLWRPRDWPEIELDFWLLPSMHVEDCYIEAAARIVDFAFQKLRLSTLVSYINQGDDQSRQVAECLGGFHEDTIEFRENGPHWVFRYVKPRNRSQCRIPQLREFVT